MENKLNLPPSLPGARFSSADLLRARIRPETLGNLILQQQAPGVAPDALALLASMLKEQRKQNAKFQPFPFNFGIWTMQQVLPENANRSYLLIQNVGNGDLLVVHEGASITPVDMSSADGQVSLTVTQTRAIRIVAGGNYEPLVAPSNPISIFTLNAATLGVVIEGS